MLEKIKMEFLGGLKEVELVNINLAKVLLHVSFIVPRLPKKIEMKVLKMTI